jgi:predicted transcriptional regulator
MKQNGEQLSARERQVMDVVYRLGEASVAEVLDGMADPPSYSAVRTHLRILEEKGHLQHREEGRRYVYLPIVPRHRAQASALERVLSTFFGDSPTRAVAALLDMESDRMTDDELDELAGLVERARGEGR